MDILPCLAVALFLGTVLYFGFRVVSDARCARSLADDLDRANDGDW